MDAKRLVMGDKNTGSSNRTAILLPVTKRKSTAISWSKPTLTQTKEGNGYQSVLFDIPRTSSISERFARRVLAHVVSDEELYSADGLGRARLDTKSQ